MTNVTFSDIRSLHGIGPIAVVKNATEEEKNKFVTCGVDGTIYIWDDKAFTTEKSAAEVKNVGEQTYSAVAWRGNHVYFGYMELDLVSGLDKKRIGKASFDNLEDVTALMSFNLEPTTIDVSEDYIIAGSSEFTIKVSKLNFRSEVDTIEVPGEVICVKIDPKQEYFSAAITDGKILIYNLKEGYKEETSIAEAFPSVSTISIDVPRVEMSWSRDGNLLFVPSRGAVKIIAKAGWEILEDVYKAPGREQDTFSISKVTHDGNILIASTMKRHICLWNLKERKFITQYEYNRNSPGKTYITGMEFAPFDRKSLIITDSNEGMCLIKNALPSSLPITPAEVDDVLELTQNRKKRILDSDDEDDEEIKKPVEAFFDDAADEDTNMSNDIGAIKKKYGFTNQRSIDDFFGPDGEREPISHDGLPTSSGPVIQKITKVVEYTPPTLPTHFSSGASPTVSYSRYLKWNAVGMIRSIKDSDINNIEIEFHNSNHHSEIIFENVANYCLGDLSEEAIALANIIEEEDEQSELWVYHVSAWDGTNRKWTTSFPKKEVPIDVMVSKQLIGVLTRHRQIRIFTLQGNQRQVISHPGATLTASCFDTKFAIVSIAGSEYYEDIGEKSIPQHNYVITIYDMEPRQWYRKESNVAKFEIPVRPGSTLSWVGYTNQGKLCVMDSSNSLRMLTRSGWWMPIYDGEAVVRSQSDALWPIAVIEAPQRQFRYLYCRGSKHPLVSLKITPSIVSWSLPLCAMDTDKSKLEHELLLHELGLNDAVFTTGISSKQIAEHLQTLIKLFALACKSERETRAWELALLVPNSKGIQALLNFATSSRRHVLSEKISQFARDNLTEEDFSTTSQRPSFRNQNDDYLAPKRVVMSKKTVIEKHTHVNSQADLFLESEEVGSLQTIASSSLDITANTSLLDMSTISATPKNPFKRNIESTSNTETESLFGASFGNNRKRAVEEGNKAAPSKQAKLDFGVEKENKTTPYKLWLDENEAVLKENYSGNIEDFPLFCINKFKLLPAAIKKTLKDRSGKIQT